MRIIHVLIAAVLFGGSLSGCSIKNKEWNDSEIIHKKYTNLAAEADEYLNGINFSGTVLIAKKDKIIFAKGYGLEDVSAPSASSNTIHTVYEAGSITKQLTAAAIMQLAQKHKLKLNDKVSKYYPDFEHGKNITIKMLLNMRSGLTDCINSADDFFPKKVWRDIEARQLSCRPLEEGIVLKYLNDAPQLAKPDSTYFYCNTNYILLAGIIEKVSGESYEEYVTKNLLEKCGMRSSNLQFQKTTAKGYDYKGRYYSIPAELAKGCGDLNTSVTDLFKWNSLLTRGSGRSRPVSKSSFKKMIKTKSYGYGLNRKDQMIFHAGNTNVFNSYMSYTLDKKVTVIVLANKPSSEINATIVAGKLSRIFSR